MKSTTRDNILYLMIALSIVGGIGLMIWYQDSHNLPIHMPFSKRAFWLFFSTAIVFGYTVQLQIKSGSQSLNRLRFCAVLSALLVLFIPLQWRILQFIPLRIFSLQLLTLAELLFLGFVLDRAKPLLRRQSK